jgi:hypothetical protein
MKAAAVTRCPGPYFTPDPDVPPDYQGRRACVHCHLLGRPGDAHHEMPDVPEQAEHRRRVGEEP